MKLTGAVLASLVGCVAALPPAPFFNGPPPAPSGSVAPAPEESSFPPPPPPSSVSGAPPSVTPEPYEKRQFGGPQPSGPPAGPSGSFGPAPSGFPEGFGRRQFDGFGGFGGPFDSAPSATPSATPSAFPGASFEEHQFPGPSESAPAGPPPSGSPSPVPFGDFGGFGKRQFGGPVESAPAGAPSGAPGPAPSEGFGGFFKRQFGSPAEGPEQGPQGQAPPFPSGVPSFTPSPAPTPSGGFEERQFGGFPTPTPVPSGPAGGCLWPRKISVYFKVNWPGPNTQIETWNIYMLLRKDTPEQHKSRRPSAGGSSLERGTTTLADRQESQPPVSAADSVLCHSCANLPMDDQLNYVKYNCFSRESIFDSMSHGIRFSVRVEAGCPLCRLAVETIRDQSQRTKDTKVEEFEITIDTSTPKIISVRGYSLDDRRTLWGRIRILEDDRDRLRSWPRTYVANGIGRKIKDGQIDFTLDKGTLFPERSDIPRTIADNRLCILQDSEAKHEVIRYMGKFYSHALLNIFALSGADANHGLPGVRPHSRPPQLIEKVRTARFLSALPSLGDSLEMSLHITRGWTFQEVLLSPRRLFVSDRQVYFHCKKNGVRCEDTSGTDTGAFEQIHGLRKRIFLLGEGVDKNTYDWQGSRSVYESLVEKYTERKLSYPADILDAFTGISSVLGYNYRIEGCEELISGLPRRDFLRYLLWSPKETPTRRLPRVTGRHEECFPSWSWIGWMCPIFYKPIGSRVIDPGVWMNEISTPCAIELIQPDGVQRVVHQPPGFCYYGYPSWSIFSRTPGQDTLHDMVPCGIVSKHPGHSVLHFYTLAVPAINFYYERWSPPPCHDPRTRIPIIDSQGHRCGILVGKTPSNLNHLLPKCKYVFLCYAHVLVRDLSEYDLDDWIYNEFDQARCVPFFLLLYRGGELWERVGLAIITWKAFENAQPEWENILLA
ncbi:HET-domain-containing protein [Aspergillus niger]|nr:HET-domain-containing protein [Aspergillus niger]